MNKGSLPTYEDDFVGAAAGLFRLQETYAIPAYDMAEGVIRGRKQFVLFFGSLAIPKRRGGCCSCPSTVP